MIRGDYQKDYSIYKILNTTQEEETMVCTDHSIGFWVFSGFLTGCILALGMSLW